MFHRKALASALLIAAGYYLGAWLGFALTLPPLPVSILWPPNAILLAGLALTPRSSWKWVLSAVLVAHLAVQFQGGVPIGMVLCWYVSNCMEALIGASLLRRFGPPRPFDSFRGVAVFLVSAGFVAPFLSSFVDAGFVIANQWGAADYWTLWRTRFFSNVVTTITLVPVIMIASTASVRSWRPPRHTLIESGTIIGGLIVVCWYVFVMHVPGPDAHAALLYVPLPFLLAAALRLGPEGASASMLICTMLAILGAGRGLGPFGTNAPALNVFEIQLFLLVVWVPVMAAAAVVREKAEAVARARDSEAQLLIALGAAQLGRWEWDVVQQRLTWSDAVYDMYEIPRGAALTPETFEACIHPDDRALVGAATEAAIHGHDVDVEFRVLRSDGRVKWIHSKGQILYDGDGRPTRIVGIKVDITRKKTAAQQRREQQRRLADTSRVSMAGELSVALAHEINQPLAATLANAGAARRYLRQEPPNLQQVAEIVDAIAEDNSRAAAIVTRFNTLLKKQVASHVRLDLNELIRTVVEIAHDDLVMRSVRVTLGLEPHLPPVLGDAAQLQQVLFNVIGNACDAMESHAAESRGLRVTTERTGTNSVRVALSDTGPGIAAERLEDIQEPFVSSRQDRIGLGLTICRSIVDAHNGELLVHSHPGAGATVAIVLPAARSVDGQVHGESRSAVG